MAMEFRYVVSQAKKVMKFEIWMWVRKKNDNIASNNFIE